MYYVFVFKKQNNEFYYKAKGYLYFQNHPLGYVNQYGHEIVLIIPISLISYKRKHPFKYFKRFLIKKSIRFLRKLDDKGRKEFSEWDYF